MAMLNPFGINAAAYGVDLALGREMHKWASDLFPIARSLTGPGVRETLTYIGKLVGDLEIHSVPSGTEAFDWIVPCEWTIRDAYVCDAEGNRIIDFKKNNLHIVGYSEPVDICLNRAALDAHLYSLPEQPDAIPYVTSYYTRRWGFCLAHRQRQSLPDGEYRVVIDADLKDGVLNYGEILIPGTDPREILLSTYVCHPSMGNNELSGPVVTTALVRWLQSEPRRFSYRIVFVPETIGSIVYLSRHIGLLKRLLVAGFVVTCIGDDRAYSYMPSRTGDSLADRAALSALKYGVDKFDQYTFLERGSDERQYCSPLIDLPVASVMRSKYGTYPEYHTSLDDLRLVTASGLAGGFHVLQRCIGILEENYTYRAVVPCEPQLGRRGLYPTLSQKGSADDVRRMMNILAYADGKHDLVNLADILGADPLDCAPIARLLEKHGLLEKV